MGLAVGYGRGYSSSADPMSVDLAVELGEGSLDSSVPLFFSCSRSLSRSSERDARIERLLTNRPSSASTPSLESSSILLLLVFAR